MDRCPQNAIWARGAEGEQEDDGHIRKDVQTVCAVARKSVFMWTVQWKCNGLQKAKRVSRTLGFGWRLHFKWMWAGFQGQLRHAQSPSNRTPHPIHCTHMHEKAHKQVMTNINAYQTDASWSADRGGGPVSTERPSAQQQQAM